MLHIERAGPSDIEPIQNLLLNQFHEHGISVAHERLAHALGELLSDPGKGLCLVARESGQIVGLAAISLAWTLEHGGKSAWLDELYVLPERRGRGVGRALLGQAIAAARDLGCAAMDLEVDRDHSRAERLYVRAGFRSLPRSRWAKSLKG